MQMTAFDYSAAKVGDMVEGDPTHLFANTDFTIYAILDQDHPDGYVRTFYLRPQYGPKHVFTAWVLLYDDGRVKASEITIKHKVGSVY